MYNITKIRENELLLGYLLDMYHICADDSFEYMFKSILGKEVTGCHTYIPHDIQKIHERLFEEEDISAKQVVESHTLYNYYTAFIDEKKKNDVLNKMLNNSKDVYKIIRYNEVSVSEHLRFCPECVREQIAMYGTFYWDRTLQIAPMCVKHKQWVRESTVPTTFRLAEYNKYITIVPNSQRIVGCSEVERALDISRRLKRIIEKPVSVTEIELKKAYRAALNKRGLLSESQRSLKVEEIKREFLKWIPKELLQVLGIEGENLNYITNPLHAHTNNVHPLYHVLMQAFLNIDIDHLEEIVPIKPNVTCYCLNPFSDHYKRHIIDDIKVHYCETTKQYMCTFSCSCGFIYTTRMDLVNSSGGTKRGKVKVYGKEYLEGLIKLRHMGIKPLVRLTGICAETIRKQLRNYDQYGQIEFEQKEDKVVTSKKARKKKVVNLTRYWNIKDEECYNKAFSVIQKELSGEAIPIRITKTRIAKEIQALNAVGYRLDKMPRTKELIEKYQESLEQHRVRKLKWVIDKYIEEKKELTVSNLQKQCNFSTKEGKNLIKETLELIAVTKEGGE